MENAINDLIIRIKNGYMAGLPTVSMPYSVFRNAVMVKLAKLGYVKEAKKEGNTLIAELIYHGHAPRVTDVRIFSTPGRRYYVSYKDLKAVIGGLGHSILSTPKGILSNIEARKEKVGGELLFNIW